MSARLSKLYSTASALFFYTNAFANLFFLVAAFAIAAAAVALIVVVIVDANLNKFLICWQFESKNVFALNLDCKLERIIALK